MKANELRIGNYITFGGQPVIVGQLLSEPMEGWYVLTAGDDVEKYNLDGAKPVSLKEGWFKDFGFEKKGDKWHKNISELLNIAIYEDKTYSLYDLEDSWESGNFACPENKLKYVHQLQNLYFALKGKELNKQNNHGS